MATIKSLRILMYVDHSRMSGALQKARRKVETAAQAMAKSLVTGFAAAKIGQGIVASIREAMKMESFAVDLSVLGGAGGVDLFKELIEKARQSPFPIEDWLLGGKRLLGAEVPIERVGKILNMLGEMAAGTGSSIKELGLVFTQIWAKGRLQGEEMLQFMERNVSLNKALQKVLGVNKKELQQLQEAGKILPEDVIKAMEEMTKKGGLFGGMMEAKMKTLAGLVTMIRNEAAILGSRIGGMWIPMLTAAGQLLHDMLKNGGFIAGVFASISTILQAGVFYLAGIVGLLHLVDRLTFGWFGWIVGIGIGFTGILFSIYLANLGIAALTGGAGIFALASLGIQKIWVAINGLITGATGGMNRLLAVVVAIGTTILWWVGKGMLTKEADQFKKMKDEAKQIAESMNSVNGVGKSVKLALFGTEGAANATAQINARRTQIALQQLEELKRIRGAVEKDSQPLEEWRGEATVWNWGFRQLEPGRFSS